MVTWLHCFWAHDWTQNGGAKGVISWKIGDRERETGRDQGQNTPFKGTSPVTYFLQLIAHPAIIH
jgi:hypothetical protein